MEFYSTRDKKIRVSFKEAVMTGMPRNGGLYMPESFPPVAGNLFSAERETAFPEIAYEMSLPFVADEIPSSVLKNLIEEAYPFEASLVRLNDHLSVLELFHGPTLAFKDFGARFMARVMSYFNRNEDKELTVLVATSGDTGSAVAHGFLDKPGIRVVLLYPSGKVSNIQEKQLTTLGKNITALEIKGSFDDCQRLVKSAFADRDLSEKLRLTSANSINIARLIPQMFYYVSAALQPAVKNRPLVFVVPSGNLGNLTAGLFARETGMPVEGFIAAHNSNHVFTDFLESGKYEPAATIPTLSNAMDVGNPSNFERIYSLFGEKHDKMATVIASRYYSDDETIRSITAIDDAFNYICDPHGAVGFAAWHELGPQFTKLEVTGIVLETAHAAKFKSTVEQALGKPVSVPERLKVCLEREKQSIIMAADYRTFKAYLHDLA